MGYEPAQPITTPGHTTWIDPADPQRGQASLFPVPSNVRGTNSSTAEAIVVNKAAVAVKATATTTRVVRPKSLALLRSSIARTCCVLGERVDPSVATECFHVIVASSLCQSWTPLLKVLGVFVGFEVYKRLLPTIGRLPHLVASERIRHLEPIRPCIV